MGAMRGGRGNKDSRWDDSDEQVEVGIKVYKQLL